MTILAKKSTLSYFQTIHVQYNLYAKTTKGSNKSGLLQEVVFKFRFYPVDLGRDVALEQWTLNTVNCLKEVVSTTGLTVFTSLSKAHFNFSPTSIVCNYFQSKQIQDFVVWYGVRHEYTELRLQLGSYHPFFK